MNDKELKNNILKISKGDKNALKYIYEDFNYVVYTLALSILHNTYDAENVSQEVFIKIWQNAANFQLDKNPKAWIIKITKNLAIDYIRKNSHSVVTDITDCSSVNLLLNNEAPVEQVLSKIGTEQLLSILPDLNRQIFIMHIMGELTYREISNLLKIPFGEVIWNYKSSVKMLKVQFEKNNLLREDIYEKNI